MIYARNLPEPPPNRFLAKFALIFTMAGAASLANQDAVLFTVAALVAVLASFGSLRSVSLPAAAVALSLLLFTYGISDGVGYTPVLITIATGLMACLAGANITKSGISYLTTIVALVAGMTVHAALNLWLLLARYGLRPETRQVDDIWTMSALAATAHAAFWTPLVGLLPFLFVWRRRGQGAFAALVLIGAVFLAASLLASRTLALLLMFVVFGWLLASRYFSSGGPRRTGASSVVMGTLGVVGVGVAWVAPGALSELPLFARLATPEGSLGDDPRIARWAAYSTRGWEHFWGGGHLKMEIGYAHSLWLDVLDAAGIPAFICVVAFSALFLTSALSIARSQSFSVGERVATAGLAVSCTAQAATEPLLEGMPVVFVVMCALAGAMAATLESRRTQRVGATRRDSGWALH